MFWGGIYLKHTRNVVIERLKLIESVSGKITSRECINIPYGYDRLKPMPPSFISDLIRIGYPDYQCLRATYDLSSQGKIYLRCNRKYVPLLWKDPAWDAVINASKKAQRLKEKSEKENIFDALPPFIPFL